MDLLTLILLFTALVPASCSPIAPPQEPLVPSPPPSPATAKPTPPPVVPVHIGPGPPAKPNLARRDNTVSSLVDLSPGGSVVIQPIPSPGCTTTSTQTWGCNWDGIATAYTSTTTVVWPVNCNGCDKVSVVNDIYYCPNQRITATQTVAGASTSWNVVCKPSTLALRAAEPTPLEARHAIPPRQPNPNPLPLPTPPAGDEEAAAGPAARWLGTKGGAAPAAAAQLYPAEGAATAPEARWLGTKGGAAPAAAVKLNPAEGEAAGPEARWLGTKGGAAPAAAGQFYPAEGASTGPAARWLGTKGGAAPAAAVKLNPAEGEAAGPAARWLGTKGGAAPAAAVKLNPAEGEAAGPAARWLGTKGGAAAAAVQYHPADSADAASEAR